MCITNCHTTARLKCVKLTYIILLWIKKNSYVWSFRLHINLYSRIIFNSIIRWARLHLNIMVNNLVSWTRLHLNIMVNNLISWTKLNLAIIVKSPIGWTNIITTYWLQCVQSVGMDAGNTRIVCGLNTGKNRQLQHYNSSFLNPHIVTITATLHNFIPQIYITLLRP